MIWVKTRNQTNWNWLTDTVRGAPNALFKQVLMQQENQTRWFKQNFTEKHGLWMEELMVTLTDQEVNSNQTVTNYVCMGLETLGGNKNTFNVDDVGYASAAAAGLTGGDITPIGASVGTKQGFSIVNIQALVMHIHNYLMDF